MNWPWADSLEQIWRSQAFPTWLTLAAAGFFGVIVLVTLLRAEKSVANGALTVIALLAVGIAVASTSRGFDTGGNGPSGSNQSPPASAALPALACVDDLAGEAVLTSCEKSVFGSAEAVAAAVSYASSQLTRLTAFGDVASANKNLTPELEALRRAVEHDRYGLMAYVLTVRDRCTPADCAAFRALTDHRHVAANMDERLYDTLVLRYAPTWGLPSATAAPVAALVSGVPTGRPTNAEFPSASSTPAVSIMTAEPGVATTSSTPRSANAPANTPSSSPRPTSPPSPAVAVAKKQAAPKPPRTATAPAPISITPAAPASAPASSAPASAPAASNQ
jgi:hypothetical protein